MKLPITYNELTIANTNYIAELASRKADGVYMIRGIVYKVKDHKATHYATNNEIYLNCGNFISQIGVYHGSRDLAKKMLKKY